MGMSSASQVSMIALSTRKISASGVIPIPTYLQQLYSRNPQPVCQQRMSSGRLKYRRLKRSRRLLEKDFKFVKFAQDNNNHLILQTWFLVFVRRYSEKNRLLLVGMNRKIDLLDDKYFSFIEVSKWISKASYFRSRNIFGWNKKALTLIYQIVSNLANRICFH